MPDLSFDRVAAQYDVTRELPPGPRQAALDQLAGVLQAIGTRTVLEVGIGTGRIAVPLAQRGYRVAGVDIAPEMLAQLRGKLPRASPGRVWAAVANAVRLPFPDRCFRACLAIHVLHLVANPLAVLAEIERTLSPGGALLYVGERFASVTAGSRVRQQWKALMAAEGMAVDHRPSLLPLFAARGWQVRPLPRIEWTYPLPVREALRQIRERVFSSSWAAPEAVHRRVCARLEAWAAETLGLDGVETVPRAWQLYEVRR